MALPELSGFAGWKGNPFLNNAKSVDTLDRSWANSKKAAQAKHAHALVGLVASLSNLGFAPRRELAAWIRRLLLRVLKLQEGIGVQVPKLTKRAIEKLISAVVAGPTSTLGVVEQRVVDAVAATRYEQPQWVARGLGDSVNATNISRRKCGDCDFQDAAAGAVIAFEPHAGKLTPIYVEGHQRTLKEVIIRRIEEWTENFGEGKHWDIVITFLAHQIPEVDPLARIARPEATATMNARLYADWLADVDAADPQIIESFERYVRAPLMERRTPESVRRTVLNLLSA